MSWWMGYGKCKCKKYRTCTCKQPNINKTTGIEYLKGLAPSPFLDPPELVRKPGNRCRCGFYRTCRCAPAYGAMPVEKMQGRPTFSGCKCSHYRTCRCLPRQNGPWAPQHEGFREPIVSGENGGLKSFGQYIYRKPIPAGYGLIPSKRGMWITFGTVVPPFGIPAVKFPIQGLVLSPGKFYKYRVLVGDKVYDVQQNYKLINGDVIDILGFFNPVVRWRVVTTNNFWDHGMIELEEAAYKGSS